MSRKDLKLFISAVREKNVRVAKKAIHNILAEKVKTTLNEKEKQIAESLFIKEDVVQGLRDILGSKSRKSVKFEDGTRMTVDLQTANVLLTVLDALKKPEAKEKFIRMVNKNANEFMKVVDFSWKQVK